MWSRLFSPTKTATLRVTSPNGFHLRPAARFATEAKNFACDIRLCKEGRCEDAKRLDALLALGLKTGDTVTLRTKGRGAVRAAETLVSLFETLMDEKPHTPVDSQKTAREETKDTRIVYPGIGVGVPYRFEPHTKNDNVIHGDFQRALERLKHRLGTRSDPIFHAQAALLESLPPCENFETFNAEVMRRIAALEGGAMEAKRDDYLDMIVQIRTLMAGEPDVSFPDEPFVLFSDTLPPSHVERLPSHVQGVVLARTSPASHTALLLRARAIPSLIVPTLPEGLPSSPVILDAQRGEIVTEATDESIAQALSRRSSLSSVREEAHTHRFEPACTKEGVCVTVLANVGSVQEAYEAKEAGAEGIGLLRTEFLFPDDQAPDLETQQKAYAEIFSLFKDVTVRTLDIGGDKPASYLHLPSERNPFLGIRGIRLLKYRPELFETQLLALYRASEGRPFNIMFPMIATPEEFDEAKAFALYVAERHSENISHVRFGMMLEVPSVLFAMDAFNERVDFYSVGTNDLAQYLFAVERTHPTLYTDDTSPALLEAIRIAIERANKPVSLCGEAGANPALTRTLIEAGLRTFSVAPAAVAELKARIRHV